jgi:phosphoenolpyruvate synthase/pyruvate phosphate dikinase
MGDLPLDGRGHAGGVPAARRRRRKLEQHYRDMQDIEFTVEQGKLYMLQTRNGKRTAKAALKIAVDMAAEG